MKLRSIPVALLIACLFFVPAVRAQAQSSGNQNVSAASVTVVPQLIKFSGTLLDAQSKPIATGPVGVIFALYAEQTGGASLWLETQNVRPDENGYYTVLLGSETSTGVPMELFASGEARWLGIQIERQPEQARVLLVSVPYALKAGDAETIGGLPPSAFVLANQAQSAAGATKTGKSDSASAAGVSSTSTSKNSAPPANPNVTGKGVVDYIPMWDTTSDIIDSVIFQKSSEIGIGTVTPAATLDVNGKGDIRDTLTLFPKGTDSSLAVSGTAFKVDQTGKVTFISGQTFPGAGTITGITTASGSGLSGGGTSGTLSLKVPASGITNTMLQKSSVTLNSTSAGGLVTPGAMTLGDTYTIGLKTCAANQILEYSGTAWACATASGTGTITGVTAGTDLKGGGTSGTVTLNLDTTKVPQLATANTFTAKQSITGNLSVTGVGASDAASFSGNDDTIVAITQTGPGDALDISSTGAAIVVASGHVVANGGILASLSTPNGIALQATENDSNNNDTTFGVNASTASSLGIGVLGTSGPSSEWKSLVGGAGVGIWGDAGSSQCCVGVRGSANDGIGVSAVSDSGIDTFYATLHAYNASSTAGALVFETNSGNSKGCSIDVDANLACNGSKSAVVPVENGQKMVALYAVEAPGNWFEDYGSEHLENGAATVTLDPTYAQTVNTGMEYHVFLTPGGDCNGLYVTNKTANSFEVRELKGGHSNIAFDYRIIAKRNGYEQIRLADKTAMMKAVPAQAARLGRKPAAKAPTDGSAPEQKP